MRKKQQRMRYLESQPQKQLTWLAALLAWAAAPRIARALLLLSVLLSWLLGWLFLACWLASPAGQPEHLRMASLLGGQLVGAGGWLG